LVSVVLAPLLVISSRPPATYTVLVMIEPLVVACCSTRLPSPS
jgi:hypothetical protein